jgi:hypothetical protein
MSFDTDAPLKADGSKDNRFAAKIGVRPTRNAPSGLGVSSSLGFNLYPAITTSLPIIRNEELMLLRAEALVATGNKAGALVLINSIRVNAGGLAPSTLTAASADAAFVTEILLQKRYSLMLEGHRWIDMRRYGRLSELPRDLTSGVNAHFVAKVQRCRRPSACSGLDAPVRSQDRAANTGPPTTEKPRVTSCHAGLFRTGPDHGGRRVAVSRRQ